MDNFLVQKRRISVIILRKIQILRKPNNQAAVTATTMFLKKVWTLQTVEVFFLIA